MLTQPIGQKRLTNIAVVRYKKQGKRFEIACYKNKVMSWRQGVEKSLDEVVQTTTIFANVSKGVLANQADLKAVFGPLADDPAAMCREILAAGELQVSDKERALQYDTLFRDAANVLVEKCVNPASGRPYTLGVIERALKEIHFAVDPKRGAKQQALEALPALAARFPIARARMRLRVRLPEVQAEALRALLAQHGAEIESDLLEGETSAGEAAAQTLVCVVDPGAFGRVDVFVGGTCGGRGLVEVISLAVHQEGEGRSLGPGRAAGGGPAAGGFVGAADRQGGAAEPSGRPDAAGEAAGGSRGGTGGGAGGALRELSARTGAAGAAPGAGGSKGLRCNACGGACFGSAAEHREHYKSAWHRMNLRRKVAGEAPLGEEDAAAEISLMGDGDGADEYSK